MNISYVGAAIRRLTSRPQGASLAELCEATERHKPIERRDVSSRLAQGTTRGKLRKIDGYPCRWVKA